jgi:hypothetical protein
LNSDVTLIDENTGSVKARYAPDVTADNYPIDAEFSRDDSRVLIVFRSLIRIASVKKSPQDLIDYARGVLPRCLSQGELEKSHLGTKPPRWCADKWPFREAPSNN